MKTLLLATAFLSIAALPLHAENSGNIDVQQLDKDVYRAGLNKFTPPENPNYICYFYSTGDTRGGSSMQCIPKADSKK